VSTPRSVPQPPVDMVMPPLQQTIFTVLVHIPFVILLGLAIRVYLRDRSPVPMLFMAGGLLATFMEPVVDVLGLCYFPRTGQWVGLETFGRPIPAFMWAVYSWFVGGQAFLFWRWMQRGTLTRHRMWQVWGITWLVNAVLELPGLLMGVYTYYGAQPFSVFGFPLWWPAINATMPVVAAYAVHRLWPHLTGAKVLFIVPLVPMADAMTNGALGWPVWNALNTGLGYAGTYPAALATFGLGVLAIWAITRGLPARRPEPEVHGEAQSKGSLAATETS
jgi:hypothetical protein